MSKAVLIGLSLACIALWVVTTFVVDSEELRWVRYVAMAVLAVVEIRVVVALYRIIFTAKTADETRERLAATGMPRPLAKLVGWEAAFWRWLFRRR